MAEAAFAAFAKNAAIFMGKTAAGAAISYFVNKALGRLSAEDEDLHHKLKAKFPVIEAVFVVGNQPQVWENQALAAWMWQFRDALQESEDALDELEYLDLEKEVKDRRAREAKGWKVSLSSRLPDFSSGLRRSLSAVATGGTSKRLKNALKGLDLVLDNVTDLLSTIEHICRVSTANHDLDSANETSRELTTTAVFGRQEEKDELLEWLGVHTPAGTVDRKLLVCAIVGGGGMGKTTLAQFVCQDKMVQDYFGSKIVWVHVSRRFEPKVLLRSILKSINPDKACAEALDSLQSDLTKQLGTTRFLLVLDDAWEDMDGRKWEQLLGPLRNNAVMGGRILLTTRMRSVAQAVKHQMRVGVKYLELKGLHQEGTLELFNHHAFGKSIPSDRLELQRIGEQIARKLKGCPFLAKVVGQHLRDNTDQSRWNTILNQDIHQCDEIGPAILEMLKMSYQNLTYEVQLCFRYCSMFPPGFKFKMEELVEMWVGSGLILQQGNKNQENIARDHFNILERKSFFSLVPRELHADPSEDYYVMHGFMYELAHSLSSEECSRFKDGDDSAEAHCISPPKVRHLYIQSITPEIITIISKSKNLRSLIIENEASSIQQKLLPDLKKSIKGRTSLRLLKLDGQGWFGMNDVVAELKHLRYIYMSATDVLNICKLFKLCHLQVLRIIKIDKEERMSPIDIGNLPSLQKLDLPKRALSTIPHIGKFTSLRELNGFSVRKWDGHKITELQNLGKLRKIIVLDVQNVSNFNEADAAKLDKKLDMKVLSLGWSNGQAGIDEHILNKLVPHRNLKHLTISRYNGIKPPMWIQIAHLSNLVHLELDGCVEWDTLPPLGSLGALEHVVLAHLPKLKCIGNSPYGSNAYGYRDNWTKGTGPGELPPHLVTFVVKDCPQLSELPDLPFSLQLLGIDGVGISSLPTMCDLKRLEPQLSTLHLRSCDFLVSLNGCFLQEEYYKALTGLKLFQCRTLSSLPNAADFQRISKMKIVEIIDCNSLLSLGGIGALSCLQVLKIEHCSNLIISSSSRLPPASVETSYLRLETLEIDDHQLLDLNPLRNLCHTRRLSISGRSKMDLLPEEWLLQNISHMEHIEISNAELLRSLPSKMYDLYALRSLVLHNTYVLRSLPRLPPNLWQLVINGCCTELSERYQVGGPDWKEINWIQKCMIA